MKQFILFFGFAALLLGFTSCEKEIRNIANTEDKPIPTDTAAAPIEIVPTDINEKGFDLLENIKGHWIGTNLVINFDYEWFTFDYRPISESHIHGIHEGGTMGNLFTSFFVTDFKDTRTIIARNGGVLNGIYRTSYFVLDSVRNDSDGDFYRLVDAVGSTNTMWMELRFKGDSLYFNSYTSQLGTLFPPTRHMTFKAKRYNSYLADAAAAAVNFPQNTPAWDFSGGFPEEYYYINSGDTEAKSCSFLWQGTEDVATLAALSGDPYTISDHPYIASLQVDVVRNSLIENKKLFLFLSLESLTDASGYLQEDPFNSLVQFPELIETQDSFTFTYLHPGDYYVTVVADANGDGYVSLGDITHVSQSITISPETNPTITLDNITVIN